MLFQEQIRPAAVTEVMLLAEVIVLTWRRHTPKLWEKQSLNKPVVGNVTTETGSCET